jgi:hypothetical protein
LRSISWSRVAVDPATRPHRTVRQKNLLALIARATLVGIIARLAIEVYRLAVRSIRLSAKKAVNERRILCCRFWNESFVVAVTRDNSDSGEKSKNKGTGKEHG